MALANLQYVNEIVVRKIHKVDMGLFQAIMPGSAKQIPFFAYKSKAE